MTSPHRVPQPGRAENEETMIVRSFPGMPRALRPLLAALALASLAGRPAAMAVEAVVVQPAVPAQADLQKKAEAPKDPTFSPEVEKKLAELFVKAKEALSKSIGEFMTREIAEIAQVTGLEEKGQQALAEPAKRAVESSVNIAVPAFEKTLRQQYKHLPDQIETILDQIISQIPVYAQTGLGGEADSDPREQEEWNRALQRTLTAEQWATWKKAEDDRTNALRQEMKGVMQASIEGIRAQYEEVLLSKSEEVVQALDLPEDRQGKLEEAAKELAENVAKEGEPRLEKILRKMPEVQRKQIVKQGRLYLGLDEDAQKKLDAGWQERLAGAISAEELKRVELAQAEHNAQRARAMGLVMLSILDERVAFSVEQRKLLQPLTERLASQQEELFPKGVNENISYNRQLFFGAGAKATDEELGAILTPAQMSRWRKVCDPKNQQDGARIRLNQPAATKKEEPPVILEPEEVEQVISDFLLEMAETELERLVGLMTLKVEDASRIVALSPEAVTRLETAARGAAEAAMTNWRSNADRNIRSQFAQIKPQHVRQRLENMGGYQFSGGDVEKQGVWEKTVKAVFDEGQLATWSKEVEERAAFRSTAAASAILAELDRKISITSAQRATLEAIIGKAIKEYEPDIARMFSFSNSVPWFLQTYTMFMPLASIPEKELQEILSKAQVDRLRGSNEFSNATHYWESVQRNHEQRVKVQ